MRREGGIVDTIRDRSETGAADSRIAREDGMIDLVGAYLTRGLDRRGFLKGMAAAGFSVAAAESVLSALAPMVEAQEEAPAKSVTMEGTASYLLVQQLKAAGVKHIFYGNGTASASMLDAMAGDNDLHLILGPEENIVTAMASGYALATNNPTFVNVAGTVGIAHQMLNLFNAKKDGLPLIVSAYVDSQEDLGRDGFESVDDLVSITKQFTRWAFEVGTPDRVPEILRNAIRISTTPPGGPTYVQIPDNVGRAPTKADIFSKEFFAAPIRTRPDPRDVEKAAQMLLEAKKPFMIVGPEVWRTDAYDDVVKLAELVGIRVVQGLSPYTDFPTGHPLYIGQTERALRSLRAISDADVMLNMGAHDLYEAGPVPMVPRTLKLIDARTAPDEVAMHNPTDLPLVANVRETAQELAEAVARSMNAAQKQTAQDRIAESRAFNEKVAAGRQEVLAAFRDNVPIAFERVAYEANLALEKDAIINHEFGSAMPRTLPWFEFGRGSKELYGRTTGSGLGWSVGASIGIKMAKPDRQVVCLLGDGAFMMGQIEALWAARRFEAPVMYIVFNNRSYNDTRMRMTSIAPKLRDLKLDMASYLGNPDVSFEQAAKAFDVKGATVTKPGELADALKQGVRELKEGRPFVLDVVAERVGFLADSTWYPKYSIADARTKRV
jgi:thiamine pyrophosphate-dependent acetolactate synthase large subunit-like protein